MLLSVRELSGTGSDFGVGSGVGAGSAGLLGSGLDFGSAGLPWSGFDEPFSTSPLLWQALATAASPTAYCIVNGT